MTFTRKSIAALVSAGLLSLSIAFSSHAEAKTLTVLVDVSESNPYLTSEAMSKAMTLRVIEALNVLSQGDEVIVQTVGSLNASQNLENLRLVIKRHNRQSVAKALAKYLLALPKQVEAQGSTNLVAWFGRHAPNCEAGSIVIVLSDAIEASEYVDSASLLSGKQALPEPHQYVALKGCTVRFIGLGAGRSDKEAHILRQAWQRYIELAGAEFKAVLL